MKNNFDVVVLGGGTAGCVAAWHLVTSGLDTCLVEAGPDYGSYLDGKWPREILNARVAPVTTHDWGFRNTNASGKDLNDLHAKVMGGCSSHNHSGAVWPPPDDFGSWEFPPNSGWSYEELFPLINRIERVSSDSVTPFRGRDGMMPTKMADESALSPWQNRLIESVLACGFPRLTDLGALSPGEGLGRRHANITGDWIRWNSSFAFIDPIRKSPKLTILPDTLVDKLVVRGGIASEVVCKTASDSVVSISANKFVLSAGPYGSPSILLRSGIGPARELSRFSIKKEIVLEGVGANLQDHPGIALQFSPSKEGSEMIRKDVREGKRLIISSILRAKSSVSERTYDLHIILQAFSNANGSCAFGTTVFDVDPKSRGNLGLTGIDPKLAPRVDYKYFSDEEEKDVSALSDGISISRRIWKSKPSAPLIADELAPGNDNVQDYIVQNSSSYHHPVGTCKMGSSSDGFSVVDYSGLVIGSDNIYVADSSIIPKIPRVNTCLIALLAGLKVAMNAAA